LFLFVQVTDTGIIKIADRMCNQLKYLHIGFCEDVSEAGKFYAREKIKGVKIVVDRINVHNCIPDNSFRQIGFPYHVRHLESNALRPNRVREMLVVFDDEFAFPINQVRDRVMMAAMERRRRAFRFRQRRPLDRNNAANQEIVPIDQGVGIGEARAAEQDEDDSDISVSSDEEMDMADGLIGPGDLFEGVEENDAIALPDFDFPLGAEFPEDFGLQD